MKRHIIITIRVNKKEQVLLSRLAHLLQRNKSDTIRYVLLQAHKKMESNAAYLEPVKVA